MSLKKMDEADNPRMESSVHGSGRGMRRKSEFLYSDVKSPKRRNEGPMEDKTQEDVKEDFQRKQAWLTFGAYTEELPPAKEQIKNQVLWKMASTSGIWSQRQVILTKSLLLIAKIDTNVISESIPLHQIDRVAIVSETGGDQVLGEFKTGSADDDLGQESKLKDQDPFKRAKPGTVFMFQIFMRPDSVVGARSFSFRAESRKDADEWVNFVSKIAERALKAHVSNNPELDSMLRLRLTMKEIYKRNSIQAFIGAMIMLNFVFNLLEAEDMPERGSPAEAFYDWLDNAFLIFFMCEMCLVLFIWQRFTFRSGWRVFDLVVIFVSVIFTFLVKGKFQVLRLVRVFRVVKGVRTLSSFRLIINALSSAVLPVLSAFGILIVVMCIYAVMAVDLFAERDPESFGNLSRALFSIFQVTTGDGWSELAKDQMLDLDETGLAFDKAVGFFFISIVLVCGVVLTNVVIAVLLDEFVQSVAAEKQAEASDAVFKANQAMEHKGPLDPLLAPLTHFNTHDDLLAKISGLFHLMDVDENGSLTLEEMRTALTKAGIHLSDEDWSDIFQSVGEDEFSEPRMNHETFSAFIQAQLKLYVQRHIASAMLEATATSSSKDSAVLFVLKHLIVAMETIMRGQDEISELQEKYHVPHAFTANTTDWQHAMASRLDHVDDRLDRFDQKLDAVLRLVGRSSAPAPAAVPAPAAEGATDSLPSDQAVATGAGGTGLFGMDALWNGLGGGVSVGRNEKPQSRQKKVPASVPTSAYLPVSYEKDAARQKIAVQGDLGHVTRSPIPPSFSAGTGSDAGSSRMAGCSEERGDGRLISSVSGVLVKVPWRAIRRKFWKNRSYNTRDVEECAGCDICDDGVSRHGLLLSDTTFVLFVIDQGSGSQAEGLCAHEFIGAPSSSAPQVCQEALEAVGVQHLVELDGSSLKTGTMPDSDGRYSFSRAPLPEVVLDAAVDAGFAEGHVLFSSEMSRRLRVPDRVPVDSVTLAMIALSK